MKSKLYRLFGIMLVMAITVLHGTSPLFAADKKEQQKEKKGWFDFSGDKAKENKKTAPKEKKGWFDLGSEKTQTKKSKSNTENGGGGGGNLDSLTVPTRPMDGAQYQVAAGVVQPPRASTAPPVSGATYNSIVRVERPVTTANTGAPTGPVIPQRPSADIRPNIDRGQGR